jgi:hypothetical protein
VLNFRYLFILFLFLSFNSYSELYCPDEYIWYCDTTAPETVFDSFTNGFNQASATWDNTMETVRQAAVDWSISATISLGGASTASSQNSWAAANSAWTASVDSWIRTNNIVVMQNSAVDAATSAWLNNDMAVSHNAAAGISSFNAANSATAAAQSALLALTGANTITTGITDIVNNVNASLTQLQTNAVNDVNNQIAGIVSNVSAVETQALTDIEEYISDSLSVDFNIGDNTVVASALDTNTNALNNLTSTISNAGGSQDNTDLVNSLDGLSSSIDNVVVPNDGSDVVSAVEDLEGGLETNTGVLDNLYSFFTDDDSSGEIDNKSTGAFNDLKNSIVGNVPSFASSGVSCPTWVFDEGALIVGGLVIDSHCSLIESVRPSLEAIMFTIFSILGFRTVFSA